MTPWYLVQFKPQSHRIAERNLARQRFETFLPLVATTAAERGRFVTRPKPLFPGYLFVAATGDPTAPRRINATLGVTRLVSIGAAPAEVPAAVVEALRARCDAEGHLVPEAADVREGDAVRLLTGPFADFVATVDRITPDRRIYVLIEILGRKTSVALEDGGWQSV